MNGRLLAIGVSMAGLALAATLLIRERAPTSINNLPPVAEATIETPAPSRTEGQDRSWRRSSTRSAASRGPAISDPAAGMAYVEANLARAQAGDHRAQYHVGMIATKCAAVYRIYLAGSAPNPDHWTYCGSFQDPTPVSDLTGQHLIDQAIAAEDPLAVLDQALIEFFAHSGARGTREALDAAIERAQDSTDPEVQAMLEQAIAALNSVGANRGAP